MGRPKGNRNNESDKIDNFIRSHYSLTYKQIGDLLNLSEDIVKQRAKRMGLKKKRSYAARFRRRMNMTLINSELKITAAENAKVDKDELQTPDPPAAAAAKVIAAAEVSTNGDSGPLSPTATE